MPLSQKEQDELELLELEEQEHAAKQGGGFGGLRQAEDRIGVPSDQALAAAKDSAQAWKRGTDAAAAYKPDMNQAMADVAQRMEDGGSGGIMDLGDTPTPEQSRQAAAFAASTFAPEILGAGAAAGAPVLSKIPGLARLATTSGAAPAGAGLAYKAGQLGKVAVQGGLGAGIGGAIESEGDPVETAKQAAMGFVGTPIIHSAIGGLSALARGGGKLRNTIAEFFRPEELTPKQLEGLRARDVIKTASGVEVPVGLAEAINAGDLTRRMGLEGAEISEKQMSDLSKLALDRAANVDIARRTPQAVSQEVFDILDPQRRGIDDTVKRAVERFSQKAVTEVNSAESQVRGIGRRFFKPGRSPKATGEDIGELAHGVLESSREDWNKAYEAARNDAGYVRANPDFSGVMAVGNRHWLDFVHDTDGNISVIGAPAGARTAVNAGGNINPIVSLEQARSFVSNLGKNLRNNSYLPGVDVRIKAEMLDAAKQAIDKEVSKYPSLAKKLTAANEMYGQNIGRFRNSLSEGIIRDVGEDGGMSGEAIIRKLTGPDAETNLEQLEQLLGKGATAGKDVSTKGVDLLQEAILSNAATKGRLGGDFNVGKMVGTIESLPEPVRNRLFPNYKVMRDAMVRESSIGQVAGSIKSPESFLSTIDADPALVQKALGAKSAAEVQQYAKQAIEAGVKAKNELSRLGLDELQDKGAFDISKFIADNNNLDKSRNLVLRLSKKDPQLLNEVRAHFLDDLFERSSVGGNFSPEKFQKLAGAPVSGAGGRAGGEFRDQLNTLFGPGSQTQIDDVVRSLGEIPRAETINAADKRNLMQYVLLGYSGASPASANSLSAGLSLISRFVTAYPEARYQFAASILSNDALRKAAMKPLGQVTVQELRRAANLTTQGIREKYGKDSDMYQHALSIENSLH